MKLYEILDKEKDFILVKNENYIDRSEFNTLSVESQKELLESFIQEVYTKSDKQIIELGSSSKELQEQIRHLQSNRVNIKSSKLKPVLIFLTLLPFKLFAKAFLTILQLFLFVIIYIVSLVGNLVSTISSWLATLFIVAGIMLLISNSTDVPFLSLGLIIAVFILISIAPTFIVELLTSFMINITIWNKMISII